jgi:hypothetical protein
MAMSANDGKIFYDCFLCKRPFQFGPHVYNGRHVAAWDAQICNACLRGNCDGVVLEQHQDLAEHLKSCGIPITLNAKGWLDIPPR